MHVLCSSRIRKLAKMEGPIEEVYSMFDQEKRGSGQYRTADEIATPEEAAAEEASMLMDKVACGDIETWDEIRPKLVELIKKAGNTECATFIESSSPV